MLSCDGHQALVHDKHGLPCTIWQLSPCTQVASIHVGQVYPLGLVLNGNVLVLVDLEGFLQHIDVVSSRRLSHCRVPALVPDGGRIRKCRLDMQWAAGGYSISCAALSKIRVPILAWLCIGHPIQGRFSILAMLSTDTCHDG